MNGRSHKVSRVFFFYKRPTCYILCSHSHFASQSPSFCTVLTKLIISFHWNSPSLSSTNYYTIVYTAAQHAAFFTTVTQMRLSVRTRVQLEIEGITDDADLSECTDDQWDDFAMNCRRPGQILDPTDAAVLIHQQPFIVPMPSLKRLKITSKMGW